MKGFLLELELGTAVLPKAAEYLVEGSGAPPPQKLNLARARVQAPTPSAWHKVSGCLGPLLGSAH